MSLVQMATNYCVASCQVKFTQGVTPCCCLWWTGSEARLQSDLATYTSSAQHLRHLSRTAYSASKVSQLAWDRSWPGSDDPLDFVASERELRSATRFRQGNNLESYSCGVSHYDCLRS